MCLHARRVNHTNQIYIYIINGVLDAEHYVNPTQCRLQPIIVNLADSVPLLDNLSITIYSIQADKYHVHHIVIGISGIIMLSSAIEWFK